MEKPLVTISIITYNQEKYVREAVRGLLSQTYEPLEIVISDDHSTDRTWDIILEEVDAYKKFGGIHKNIVLNRNEKNLGIAGHCNYVNTLKHGIIEVACGGDDISMPKRVQRIVDEWERHGRTASYIWHWSVWIDEKDRVLHVDSHYNLDFPSGALCAYVRPCGNDFCFGDIDSSGWEDWIGAFRTRFYGDALEIKEPLIYYRYGTGVSTSNASYRKPLIRCAKAIQISIKQARLEVQKNADKIKDKISDLVRYLDSEEQRTALLLEQINGSSFSVRWRAMRKRFPKMKFSRGYLIQVILTLPQNIGDPILDAYQRIKLKFQQLQAKTKVKYA